MHARHAMHAMHAMVAVRLSDARNGNDTDEGRSTGGDQDFGSAFHEELLIQTVPKAIVLPARFDGLVKSQ